WYYPPDKNRAWQASDPHYSHAYVKVPAQPFFDPGNSDILLAHGVLSYGHRRGPPEQFRLRIDPALYSVHAFAEHAGRPCVVLRTPSLHTHDESFSELWVDVDRDAAIVREVYYARGEPYSTTSIEYGPFEGTWMPTALKYGQGVHRALELQVAELRLNIDLDPQLFQVRVPAGMRLQTPEGVFTVDRETDVLAARPGRDGGTRPAASFLVYAFWATLAVSVGLLVRYLVVRWRRRAMQRGD
ncbi:MAG: hypothetical protein K6T86_17725, partial [Pirellulales bacterium]|nr:hypothetical protein [Pirellulales bacterium]